MKTPGAVLVLLLGLGLLLLVVATANADDLDQLELKKIKSEVQYFEARLQVSEKEIQQLKKHVAFTAVLQPSSVNTYGFGSIGPYTYDMTLIHQKVLTNVGQAYNSNSGIFTAPVRGVYFFMFTTSCRHMERGKGLAKVQLMKNAEEMLLVWELQYNEDAPISLAMHPFFGMKFNKERNTHYASNSAMLLLERGDEVYLQLPKGTLVDAMSSNSHTFSGFLLYPTDM